MTHLIYHDYLHPIHPTYPSPHSVGPTHPSYSSKLPFSYFYCITEPPSVSRTATETPQFTLPLSMVTNNAWRPFCMSRAPRRLPWIYRICTGIQHCTMPPSGVFVSDFCFPVPAVIIPTFSPSTITSSNLNCYTPPTSHTRSHRQYGRPTSGTWC